MLHDNHAMSPGFLISRLKVSYKRQSVTRCVCSWDGLAEMISRRIEKCLATSAIL
jgi:hypothetical protein